jgi:hypothetical protein
MKMGDREFEDFLNNKNSHNNNVPEDKKRLLFDIIQQKMDNSAYLVDTLSKLYLKTPKEKYTDWLDAMMVISKQSFEQIEYLMGIIIDDIEEESGEDDEE